MLFFQEDAICTLIMQTRPYLSAPVITYFLALEQILMPRAQGGKKETERRRDSGVGFFFNNWSENSKNYSNSIIHILKVHDRVFHYRVMAEDRFRKFCQPIDAVYFLPSQKGD